MPAKSDADIDSASESVAGIDLTSTWDPEQTTVATEYKKPKIKRLTDYRQKLRAANKIKKKYLRKGIGNRNN